jgi:hypothetical protein
MSEEQTTTAVAAEPSFADWAKTRTFGPSKSDTKEVTPAGAEDKTGQAAPGDNKAAGVTDTAPEEIKAADPDDEKEDDETTAEALKNPGAKKRLGGWARKAQKAETRAEALQRENDTLKAQLAAKPAEAAPVKAEPAKTEAAVAATPKPKPDDFQSVDDYQEALVDWKFEQKLSTREQTKEQKDKQDAEKAKQDSIMQGWDKQIAAVTKEPAYADFVSVVVKGGVQYAGVISQALYEDDNGPQVAYQLAKDPALLKELNEMSPAKAIAKIGRLSAKFDPVEKTEPVITQEKPTPKQSAAPTPIRASAAPTQTSVRTAEEMSNTEWNLKRNKATGYR